MYKFVTNGTIGLIAAGFLDTDGLTVLPISASNPLPGSPTGGDASVSDISTKLASNSTIGLVALGYLGDDGETIVPISAANPVPTSGGGSSGIEVSDGTNDFTGITKLLISGGTVSEPTSGEAEITVGGVDPYAWTTLTFSETSPSFGAGFHISDQTFTVADGDKIEVECGIDNVGNGTGGSGINGVGVLLDDTSGFMSYLDQNANRALGVLADGDISSVPYYLASGLQQGGGNWALDHDLVIQTSKATPGTCSIGIGSTRIAAQGGYMIAGELAGTVNFTVLMPTTGSPSILWARARIIKAT